MKKIILTIVFTLGILQYVKSLPYWCTATHVYTCEGGRVAAGRLNSSDLSVQDKAAAIDDIINPNGAYYFLGIQPNDIIGDATSSYNCHSYAWYITANAQNRYDPVWIDNASSYEEEGCYEYS